MQKRRGYVEKGMKTSVEITKVIRELLKDGHQWVTDETEIPPFPFFAQG